MLCPLWVSLHSISNKNTGVLLSIRRSTCWSTGDGWVAGLEPTAYSIQSLQCQIWMRRNVYYSFNISFPQTSPDWHINRICCLPPYFRPNQIRHQCRRSRPIVCSGVSSAPIEIYSLRKLASVSEWCWAQWRSSTSNFGIETVITTWYSQLFISLIL